MPKFPTDDPDYRIIRRVPSRYLHYHFYIRDPVIGALSMCVGTYLPFQTTYYLNGHNFMEIELRQQGVAFRVFAVKNSMNRKGNPLTSSRDDRRQTGESQIAKFPLVSCDDPAAHALFVWLQSISHNVLYDGYDGYSIPYHSSRSHLHSSS